MRIFLDTHIVLFAAFGTLSKSRTVLLKDSANQLFFSQISAWEITKLVQLGKIQIEGGLNDFLHKLYTHPRYSVVGLEPDILVNILADSDKMHKDPADQIIVASAKAYDAAIMTSDQAIQQLDWIECV